MELGLKQLLELLLLLLPLLLLLLASLHACRTWHLQLFETQLLTVLSTASTTPAWAPHRLCTSCNNCYNWWVTNTIVYLNPFIERLPDLSLAGRHYQEFWMLYTLTAEAAAAGVEPILRQQVWQIIVPGKSTFVIKDDQTHSHQHSFVISCWSKDSMKMLSPNHQAYNTRHLIRLWYMNLCMMALSYLFVTDMLSLWQHFH